LRILFIQSSGIDVRIAGKYWIIQSGHERGEHDKISVLKILFILSPRTSQVCDQIIMTVPLLQTKLNLPTYQPNLVPRPALLARLSKGLSGKLTLASAPAGFGKSTLLVEWIRNEPLPFGWINLDESDNDIGRFLAYFIASLGTIPIPLDPRLPNLLHSPDKTSLEEILISIINQISNVDQHFGLVLDDYHLIQSEEVHSALAYLLDYLPPNMHLVISGRADPPLNLAKLRASGQMTEIRASHLRFSLDEINQLLNQLRGFNLADDELMDLMDRTDGWIAGLQMVSLALEGITDRTQYIRDFSGNQEYIADYLTSEVFTQQPESIQQFLLRTSILNRFCASLCEAITGQGFAQRTLKYLKDKNLFLISLDDKNQWYRYHSLFADLNHQRLLEIQAGEVPAYYQKASEWFEANGYVPEAIDYAFRGNLIHRAAALIEEEAKSTLIRSEIPTFIRWVEKLPDEVICSKESLCIYYAWALLVSLGEESKAANYLSKVVSADESAKGRMNAVKAMLAFYQRDIDEAIHLARTALTQLPGDDHFFRHVAAWNLSALLFINGDTEEGAQMLEEVARISLDGGNLLVAIIALSRLGSIRYQQGNLELAKELFEQAIDVKPVHQSQPLPAACEAMLGLGKVYWEFTEYDTAKRYLHEGIQLSKRWREITDVDGFITLAHIYQSKGDDERANQFINESMLLASRNTGTETGKKYVASQGALIGLRQSNHSAVERWAVSRGFEEIIRDTNFNELGIQGADIVLLYELVVYARFLMADDQVDKGLKLLDKLLPPLERLGHQSKIIETRLRKALGLQAKGRIGEAVAELNAVLAGAEKGGYKRIFIDEGQEMARLIETSIARGYRSHFADEILGLMVDKWSDDRVKNGGNQLIEPLSDREVEVLRLLDSTLSIPEIAGHLYIAVSTLRTHVRNIYRKLGVHSRFEAVSEGKALKII
jgi:LuxR family maltose regulon positive regulatory protein